MKKALLFLVAVVFGIAAVAQNYTLKPNNRVAFEPTKAYNLGEARQMVEPNHNYKNTDFVTIIAIGTSANAYGYGYAGGQKSW